MKLAKKLEDQRKQTAETKAKWQTFQKTLDEKPDSSMTGDCRKKALLQFISLIYEQQQSLASVIELKKLVNHNEGKITVVRAKVHGISEVVSPDLSESHIEMQVEDMEEKLRDVEEESGNLDAEINSTRVKTSTIEKEVRRNKGELDIADLDRLIQAAKEQIEQLEDML